MVDKLVVPRRKVKKNWYGGLHPDHVDRTHPDVHDDSLVMEAMKSTLRKLFTYCSSSFININSLTTAMVF